MRLLGFANTWRLPLSFLDSANTPNWSSQFQQRNPTKHKHIIHTWGYSAYFCQDLCSGVPHQAAAQAP